MVSVDELVDIIHGGCPNEEHCCKDEEKCMYLVKHRCLIREIREKGELL